MNIHTISGRLTRDPEMVGQDGSVAKFAVAVDGWNSAKQEKEPEFFDCVAFGKQAETVKNYLSKGRFVIIRGKQKSRKYESKKHPGEEVKVWELIVDELELGPKPASATSEQNDASSEDVAAAPVRLW